MTRIYLSPTATFFVKCALILVEGLIGLYNLFSYPIRKITIKRYCKLMLLTGVFCAAGSQNAKIFVFVAIALAMAVITTRLLHKHLKTKVSPKIAYLISSPMGIPLNKFYKAV